ncbi:unnamed protein product [Prorocentrum cordatum]|uniref:Uncharacterized protein n=1 Tax=Prorocentrum cordatum TaxID=2364126 RepID=A0ABN9PYE6_9DINO|nr:unnamed protein product [Polarella glacialis]
MLLLLLLRAGVKSRLLGFAGALGAAAPQAWRRSRRPGRRRLTLGGRAQVPPSAASWLARAWGDGPATAATRARQAAQRGARRGGLDREPLALVHGLRGPLMALRTAALAAVLQRHGGAPCVREHCLLFLGGLSQKFPEVGCIPRAVGVAPVVLTLLQWANASEKECIFGAEVLKGAMDGDPSLVRAVVCWLVELAQSDFPCLRTPLLDDLFHQVTRVADERYLEQLRAVGLVGLMVRRLRAGDRSDALCALEDLVWGSAESCAEFGVQEARARGSICTGRAD